ncbi:MAG TPA: phosphoadenosine phosphosulfate reductase family protein [Nitrospirota bacterium]|jgi:3'-phosphoadenosine 5'-phosphosulfate sulfotransferase (PAPS reductase)/FAD synthetase
MDAFETKTQEAGKLVRDTLAGGAGIAVAFGGGIDSMVLLHMVRTASGKIECPVVGFDPPGHLFPMHNFIRKIESLWGFRVDRIDWTEISGQGASGFPLFSLLSRPCRARGFTRVLTGLRAEEVGTALDGRYDFEGISFINPLANFSVSDSLEYLKKYKVPLCSLYDVNSKLGCFPLGGDPFRGTCDVPVHPLDAKEEEEEVDVKARLKALGYM